MKEYLNKSSSRNIKIDNINNANFFLEIMTNDYSIKNHYIDIIKKEFVNENIEYVQLGKIISKEKLNQLDYIINELNIKMKRNKQYTRSDILRIAIKLYIHFKIASN